MICILIWILHVGSGRKKYRDHGHFYRGHSCIEHIQIPESTTELARSCLV